MEQRILTPNPTSPAALAPEAAEPAERPGYLALAESGELAARADALWAMLEQCDICPRDCRVNRLAGEVAACFSAELPVVSSVVPHFGEEPCLTGARGSGNVFFGLCNMRCVYCQNYQISQNYKDERRNEMSIDRLADSLLELQALGCHVINFVSPTHFVPQMVRAIQCAAPRGLHLPIVYNTNAYDSVAVLELLEGIVDVYLPDMKYGLEENGRRYSYVRNYVERSREAIAEMWRQVGPLRVGSDGLARRGLIVRHLVLPNDLADSECCLTWLREAVGPDVALSLMAQYFPTHKAGRHVLLDRKTRPREYERVVEFAERLGFKNILVQEFEEASEFYRPDFAEDHPFHWGETARRMFGARA